jgi:hypothetical protein
MNTWLDRTNAIFSQRGTQPIAMGQKQPLPTITGSYSITGWVEAGYFSYAQGFVSMKLVLKGKQADSDSKELKN